jgi:hypothetical protein
MTALRNAASATLLADGRVLIVGGSAGGHNLTSAELFSPDTGIFTATGSMTYARSWQTATSLPGGRVLIVGGSGNKSAEIYNPANGRFSRTSATKDTLFYQTATALNDGRVLIAGGTTGATYLAKAEIYNPFTGKFSRVARSMHDARAFASAVLLPDGRVLIAGGDQGISKKSRIIVAGAEIFDPATGRFSQAASMHYGRSHFELVLLSNGSVLAIGGLSTGVYAGISTSAEIYDPNANTWTVTGPMSIGRSDFSATLLADGRVLVAGGGDNSSEIFDPSTATFQMAHDMLNARVSQTATLLADTRVLMAGGNVAGDTAAEFYDP